MDIRQTIINVINTLNTVPAVGRQNMEKMLGCIAALEKVVGEMGRPEKEDEKK